MVFIQSVVLLVFTGIWFGISVLGSSCVVMGVKGLVVPDSKDPVFQNPLEIITWFVVCVGGTGMAGTVTVWLWHGYTQL